MSYIPITDEDKEEMLKTIGVSGIEDLFSIIPPELRAKSFDLAPSMSEFEVDKRFRNMAARNSGHLQTFVGGGFYDHFIPAAVDAVTSRSEFYTAYTPYQPEASQGTLQAVFEFQSSICRLTGMEASNASLYDGGTALYEAMMMAARSTRRTKIVMDGGVNPIYRKMIRSYTTNLSIDFVETPVSHGRSDREAIKNAVDDQTAAVIVQNPNFFGAIDDFTDIAEICHAKKALLISSVYPISLGLLKSPGEMNVDIAVGEGQSLGIPLSFGGPYLGFMATNKKLMRKMPGRIAGETTDKDGNRCFVLTLQAREQHIRRESATSNICTNQALCALRALVYMSLMGDQGLRELAQLCLDKAEYAKDRLDAIPGVEVKRSTPTFNEFIVKLPRSPSEVVGKMIDKGYAAGFPLGRYYPALNDYLLIAVTEKRTKQEIGMFAEALEDVLCN